MRLQRLGLSLIEVLIALAVIGVAFGILAVTQVGNLRISAESRLASQATEIANTELEGAVRCLLSTRTAFESVGVDCVDEVGAFTDGRFEGLVEVRQLGDAYEQEGLLVVTARITEPVQAVFARLVSCIDVQPAPAIADHPPCPEPVVSVTGP